MNVMVSGATAPTSKVSFKKKRKQDALDLAVLLYDIYKERERRGQNNANQVKKNTPHA